MGNMEQKLYDKYACWCETTTARKAWGIHQGMADIKSLGSKILSLKGKVATLSSEISELSKGLKDSQQAQDGRYPGKGIVCQGPRLRL